MHTQISSLVTANAFMSTKEVAALTDKQHSHVVRDARAMLAQIQNPYLDSTEYKEFFLPNGMTQEILLNKDLTICLVAGYDANVRFKIIKRWQELENAQPVMRMPTHAEAMRGWADEIDAHAETKAVMQQATGYLETAVGILKRDAPKVKVHDTIMHSEGALLISDAARVLNVSQTKLFTFLERSRLIFRAGKHKKYKAYAPHIHNGNLVQLVKDAVNHDGDPVVTSQVQITAQGIAVLANLLVG